MAAGLAIAGKAAEIYITSNFYDGYSSNVFITRVNNPKSCYNIRLYGFTVQQQDKKGAWQALALC